MIKFKGLNALGLLGAAKDRVFCGPQRILIDINTDCNINCIYCWNHSPKIPPFLPSRNINFERFKEIVHQAKIWQTREISISGDGEPTLHPDIERMIELIKGCGLSLILSTNLTFAPSLLNPISKVDNLLITICATSQKSYQRIQSPKNKYMFSRVIENLKALSKITKKRGKPYLRIIFIICKESYREIIPMLELARDLKIDRIFFRMIDVVKETKSLLLNKKEERELQSILSKTTKIKKPHHNLKEILDGLRDYKKSEFGFKSCYIGWFELFINYNGTVFLCCHNDKKSRIIGNIYYSSLKDIWKGKRALKMRLKDKYKFDLNKEPWKDKCNWCFWADYNHSIDEAIHKLNLEK